MRWLGYLGGALAAATLGSVVTTFVVPRDTPSRIPARVSQLFLPVFRRLARLFGSYESKDDFLAYQAPVFLLLLLTTWLGLLVVAFGLLLWAITTLGIGGALVEAGSSLLTLGIASTERGGASAIDIVAAASGFTVIALFIGYLPVIYGAYNRRERTVTMLESRAGAPAWGPEILWRHQRIGIMDSLPEFYLQWEQWCADVAETHSTYPILLFFRSPHPLRSWLTGLIAVLDSAALYNALSPNTAPSETRLCLRMGFTSLRSLADVLEIPYDPDPRPNVPIRLSFDEYMGGVQRLADIGFPMERTPAEAWPHFSGWRVNYEEVALELADRIVATPGPWSGTRTGLADFVIPTRRPVDRTPDEPEGTKYTRPGAHETG